MHIIPSLHPAHILRQNRRLSGTVELAFNRAYDIAYNDIIPRWVEKEFILKPTAEQVVKTLASMAGTPVAFDVETDGEHPLNNQLRCVGFYNGKVGITVPLLYRDGSVEDVPVVDKKGVIEIKTKAVWKKFYTGDDERKVLQAMAKLLGHVPENPVAAAITVLAAATKTPKGKKAKQLKDKTAKTITKVALSQLTKFDSAGWQGPAGWKPPAQWVPPAGAASQVYTQNGQYDRMVMKAQTGIIVRAGDTGFTFDTMVAHHVICPYLPHGLGFLASMYTPVPFYKSTEEGEAWSAGSDEQLWRYCVRDCKVTWLIAQKMQQEVLEEFPTAPIVFEQDTWQEAQCQRWKEVGVEVDPHALAYFRWHYSAVRDRALAKMRELLEKRGLQSNDANFIALLEKLAAKADIDEVTGEESDEIIGAFNPASLIELRMMLAGLGIPLTEVTATGQLSTAKELLTGVRKKMLSDGAQPDDDRIAFLDYLFAWRESAKVIGTYLYPAILADGRVHPTFSVHVVPTGRLSSQQPNYQNQPAEIRGMYVARKGHVIVSMDWDALEMRLGAFLSGDPAYIEVFRQYDAKTGPKPHHANMAKIFGLPATKQAAEQNPGMYRAAKVFAYAVAYGAGDDTVFEQVREELPDMDWPTFQVALANYKKAYAKLFAYMKDIVAQGCSKGYIDSELNGRRMFFFEPAQYGSSSEATAMQNGPFQSGGADIVGQANRRVMDRLVLPWRATKLLKRGDKRPDGTIQMFDEVLEQLAQVHDELVFEVPERIAEEFMRECKKISEEKPRKWRADGTTVELDWNLPVDIHAARRWKPVQARCGAEMVIGTGKTKKVAGKCRELVDIELEEGSETVWVGCCEHGHKKRIEVGKAAA